LEPPTGVEPVTCCLQDSCSGLLSYRGVAGAPTATIPAGEGGARGGGDVAGVTACSGSFRLGVTGEYGMLGRMKSKTLIGLLGAVGGTAVATGGVVMALMGGDGEGGAGARPVASVGERGKAGEFATVLERYGAVGCRVEQSRVECRANDRYVAAQVVGPELSMESLLGSWKTGTAQAMTGDRGSFAILRGPNWLVTGPDSFVAKVRPELGGRIIYCDRPYGGC
jgi:hypothetical protein